jgi:serine/threonine-protein kinase
MGRVYLAQEELTGKQAALKILAAELAQDAGFLHRFQREIQTLSTLDHPNIVHFYESGFENGMYFYAMEYVEGEGLDRILDEKGRLPWRDVLDIALQVCPALKHAHDHGIIHRDIKPANLLRTAAGMVKLTDFGIAKVFAGTHLTATGGVVGTAEYLSPEQAAGKPVSKRSDLYSLGVVLYTLLTGRAPFEGATFLELLHKHRYAQFDPPRNIVVEMPYELDEIVCELLAKEPDKRPPDALVLAKRLEVLRRKLERKGNLTSGDLVTETVAESRPESFAPDHLPGPATLMSRLMREELLRQARGGPIYRFINRPIILITLFILCITVLAWTFWPASARGLYEKASRLMASPDATDWELAWREYLQPLGERFPDHPYQQQVAEFRQRIEAARAKDKAGGVSEAQRFYSQGKLLRQNGNPAAARAVWQNLVNVFADVPAEAEWVRRASEGLDDLEKAAAEPQRWVSVRAALKRADELAGQGNRKGAEVIWLGIEELYRNDPSAQTLLDELRTARDRLANQQKSTRKAVQE